MKRIIVLAIAIMSLASLSEAKVKFGIRGGLNITNMSFNYDVINANNKSGMYIGPTMKVGLPLGFDIDASLLYNKMEVKTDIYNENNEYIKMSREALSVPLNLRKGFGLGDKASVFIFAGPQFSVNIGDKKITEFDWKWKNADISVNVGAGAMLLNFLELKANYNIPCSNSGSSEDPAGVNESKVTGKTGGWQIGMALYF